MSIYSQISRQIGHSLQQLAYPEKEQVLKTAKAAEEGVVPAFKDLFTWYRHLQSPTSPEQIEIITLISEQFAVISPQYQQEN